MVYVLHWYTGYYGTMVGYVQDPYETALSKGDVQEMIFVFPDASNKLGGSQYLSSPTIGDYETYITQELVDLVDANLSHHPRPQQPRHHRLFYGRRWIDGPGVEVPERIQCRSASLRHIRLFRRFSIEGRDGGSEKPT